MTVTLDSQEMGSIVKVRQSVCNFINPSKHLDGVADVDECSTDGGSTCHEKATCYNEPGSFSCTCNTGSTGNGSFCEGMSVIIQRKRERKHIRGTTFSLFQIWMSV